MSFEAIIGFRLSARMTQAYVSKSLVRNLNFVVDV